MPGPTGQQPQSFLRESGGGATKKVTGGVSKQYWAANAGAWLRLRADWGDDSSILESPDPGLHALPRSEAIEQ